MAVGVRVGVGVGVRVGVGDAVAVGDGRGVLVGRGVEVRVGRLVAVALASVGVAVAACLVSEVDSPQANQQDASTRLRLTSSDTQSMICRRVRRVRCGRFLRSFIICILISIRKSPGPPRFTQGGGRAR